MVPREALLGILIWGSVESFRSFVMRDQSKWLVAKEKKKEKKRKELWEASLNSYATYRGKLKFKISLELVQRDKRPTWPTKMCSIWYHTDITSFFQRTWQLGKDNDIPKVISIAIVAQVWWAWGAQRLKRNNCCTG